MPSICRRQRRAGVVHDATVVLKHFAMGVSGDKYLMVGLGPFLAAFIGHQGGQVRQVDIVAVGGADQRVVADVVVAAHQAVDDLHIIVIAVPGLQVLHQGNVGVVVMVARTGKQNDRCDLTKPIAELDLELEAFAEDHLGSAVQILRRAARGAAELIVHMEPVGTEGNNDASGAATRHQTVQDVLGVELQKLLTTLPCVAVAGFVEPGSLSIMEVHRQEHGREGPRRTYDVHQLRTVVWNEAVGPVVDNP